MPSIASSSLIRSEVSLFIWFHWLELAKRRPGVSQSVKKLSSANFYFGGFESQACRRRSWGSELIIQKLFFGRSSTNKIIRKLIASVQHCLPGAWVGDKRVISCFDQRVRTLSTLGLDHKRLPLHIICKILFSRQILWSMWYVTIKLSCKRQWPFQKGGERREVKTVF